MFYSSSSGNIELELTYAQACYASHQGQCGSDVRGLSKVPAIASQLEKLDADTVRSELREYGAWDAVELADDAQNAQRLLWLKDGEE